MAPGFITRASNYCTPAEEGNINFGYRFLVRLCDKNGGNYDLNVIVVDEKNSEDRSDLYPHNNIVEFVTNNTLSDDITEGGNVSFDKLLGGTELEIEEVYMLIKKEHMLQEIIGMEAAGRIDKDMHKKYVL